MVKNGYVHSGQETLRLAASQEWIDRMNWMFKIMKAKMGVAIKVMGRLLYLRNE